MSIDKISVILRKALASINYQNVILGQASNLSMLPPYNVITIVVIPALVRQRRVLVLVDLNTQLT